MGLGFWQVAIVGGIVVLLFGRGKVSELMGDVGKGIKSFKKGLSEEEAERTKTIEHGETVVVVEPVEKTHRAG